ncbi:MAG: prepilin-type N-terminal cleavage/methylation domain-containing protein [Candidatus Magasanikbacteria bacterium]|nr:prepilin-type N-terminal cleavage/methylation domain-containing protein [Candidatus Magasanikbacteria bacterium]
MKKLSKNLKGFTLIELLIVIAIIAILAGVAYVALDPLTRFRDARDSTRWSDVSAMLSAIKVNQVDNGGTYLASIAALTPGTVYMISGDGTTTGCNAQNTNCDVAVTATGSCVNLNGLVTAGYIGKVPVSPNGNGAWTTSISGYTLTASTTGIITIAACESENTTAISVVR